MSSEFISKDDLFCGSWTPFRLEVLRSPRLSTGAKVLYAELCSYLHQGSAKRSWPSQELLARNLSCNVRTIRRWTDELISVEVIKVEKTGMGKSNSYWLHRPMCDKLGVYEDAKGRMLPVAVPNADTGVRIGQDTGVLSNADADVLSDRLSVSAENEISGVTNSSGARVSAIGVGGEEQGPEEEESESQAALKKNETKRNDDDDDFIYEEGKGKTIREDSEKLAADINAHKKRDKPTLIEALINLEKQSGTYDEERWKQLNVLSGGNN